MEPPLWCCNSLAVPQWHHVVEPQTFKARQLVASFQLRWIILVILGVISKKHTSLTIKISSICLFLPVVQVPVWWFGDSKGTMALSIHEHPTTVYRILQVDYPPTFCRVWCIPCRFLPSQGEIRMELRLPEDWVRLNFPILWKMHGNLEMRLSPLCASVKSKLRFQGRSFWFW